MLLLVVLVLVGEFDHSAAWSARALSLIAGLVVAPAAIVDLAAVENQFAVVLPEPVA